MRTDADALHPQHPQQQQSACVPQQRRGPAVAAGSGSGVGALQQRRTGADLSRVERSFPDMDEMLELLRLLRRATGNPTAVFRTPFQVTSCYQAVTCSHEMTIVLPTGACTCGVVDVWCLVGCASSQHTY